MGRYLNQLSAIIVICFVCNVMAKDDSILNSDLDDILDVGGRSKSYNQELDLVDDAELRSLVDEKEIDILSEGDLDGLDLEGLQLEEEFKALGKEIDDELHFSAKPSNKLDKKNSKLLETQDEKIKQLEATKEEFKIGKEEQELIRIAKLIYKKIPSNEWNDMANAAKVGKYVIQKGENLWSISKKLFGSGFYYSKIWALNPHITNPHKITPNTSLVFTTGDEYTMPDVQVGGFSDTKVAKSETTEKDRKDENGKFNMDKYTRDMQHEWLKKRKEIVSKGAYFQYATGNTYEDLAKIGKLSTVVEYKKYNPPDLDELLPKETDKEEIIGFDKYSKIKSNFKQGFDIKTFVTTNILKDFGEVVSSKRDNIYLRKFQEIYVKMDQSVNPQPGDLFSLYNSRGIVQHGKSDRKGYNYSIAAHIEIIGKEDKLWKALVYRVIEPTKLNSRITTYIPNRIDKIPIKFSLRKIEAIVVGNYGGSPYMSMGNIIYLDRVVLMGWKWEISLIYMITLKIKQLTEI